MSHTSPVTIRRAGAADLGSLSLLASLDGHRLPDEPMLVAETEGRMIAAVPFGGGRAIADPFEPTAEVVTLLEMRARQMADTEGLSRARGGLLRRLAARAA